ncbi:hypothetical protein BS47DRAFT_1358600 [Hydnum rufescens UP504]|uniref:Uncharacterized protein n=1 Tax=Hydnum rufescens UP504 TaxID=1448309 RepID=A0A9P6B7K1_9AGAM|nr:hypothetical protein BS47DRAFT_1358600 [Hydnum rufescens UP504]
MPLEIIKLEDAEAQLRAVSRLLMHRTIDHIALIAGLELPRFGVDHALVGAFFSMAEVDFPFEELERHGVPSKAFESWMGKIDACGEFLEIWRMQPVAEVKRPSPWIIKFLIGWGDESQQSRASIMICLSPVFEMWTVIWLEHSPCLGSWYHYASRHSTSPTCCLAVPARDPMPQPTLPTGSMDLNLVDAVMPDFNTDPSSSDEEGSIDDWNPRLQRRKARIAVAAQADPLWDAVQKDLPVAARDRASAEYGRIVPMIQVAQNKRRVPFSYCGWSAWSVVVMIGLVRVLLAVSALVRVLLAISALVHVHLPASAAVRARSVVVAPLPMIVVAPLPMIVVALLPAIVAGLFPVIVTLPLPAVAILALLEAILLALVVVLFLECQSLLALGMPSVRGVLLMVQPRLLIHSRRPKHLQAALPPLLSFLVIHSRHSNRLQIALPPLLSFLVIHSRRPKRLLVALLPFLPFLEVLFQRPLIQLPPIQLPPIRLLPIQLLPIQLLPIQLCYRSSDPAAADPAAADSAAADPATTEPIATDLAVVNPVGVDPAVIDPAVVDQAVVDQAVVDPVVPLATWFRIELSGVTEDVDIPRLFELFQATGLIGVRVRKNKMAKGAARNKKKVLLSFKSEQRRDAVLSLLRNSPEHRPWPFNEANTVHVDRQEALDSFRYVLCPEYVQMCYLHQQSPVDLAEMMENAPPYRDLGDLRRFHPFPLPVAATSVKTVPSILSAGIESGFTLGAPQIMDRIEFTTAWLVRTLDEEYTAMRRQLAQFVHAHAIRDDRSTTPFWVPLYRTNGPYDDLRNAQSRRAVFLPFPPPPYGISLGTLSLDYDSSTNRIIIAYLISHCCKWAGKFQKVLSEPPPRDLVSLAALPRTSPIVHHLQPTPMFQDKSQTL